jgi:hypothetical protein
MRNLFFMMGFCAVTSLSPMSAAPNCDRTCLTGFVDRYLDALVRHDPSRLPLAPNAVFTENGSRLTVGAGLWKTATRVVTRREVFSDQSTGQTAFWGVIDEGGSPVMLSMRLKVENERVTEIETIAARRGSHALFAPDAFGATPPAFQQPLAAAQRVSRERLIAAANGYFDGIEHSDNKLVASANECNRFENGTQMTNRNGAFTPRACAMAVDRLGYIKRVFNRRYPIVDEERGVVFSTIVFDIPADARATPPREARMLLLSEVFKIVSGNIERIETVMHNLPYGSSSGWREAR